MQIGPGSTRLPDSGVDAPVSSIRSARIESLPILLVNVHEHCNCRCVMCDIWQRTEGRELNLEDFSRHRESMRNLGVRQVVLTGGEPLLHRNFEGLCRFLRECDMRITLLTTGLLLAKKAEIVARHVDEVIISIDGPENIHDRIRRVPGAFKLIRTGIETLRRFHCGMPVHGRSTVQKANYSSLRETVACAKDLGLNSISFLAADLTSQAFNRDMVWPGDRQAEIALTASEVDQLDREVNLLLIESADDIRTRFVAESPEKIRGIVRRFREHLGELLPVAPTCNAPWVSAVLEIDGTVRPCFFHKKIGSVGNTTLEEVLNGEEAQEFRADLNVAQNAICQRCVCSLHYRQAPDRTVAS